MTKGLEGEKVLGHICEGGSKAKLTKALGLPFHCVFDTLVQLTRRLMKVAYLLSQPFYLSVCILEVLGVYTVADFQVEDFPEIHIL